jgi:hypothetical protein
VDVHRGAYRPARRASVTWEAVKRLAQPTPHLRGVRLPFIRGARVHEDRVSEITLKLPVA